jgi:redox-regulated HSP33 family molecular chaperone
MNKAQAKREAKKIAAGLICQALAGEWQASKTDADWAKVKQALSELAQNLSLKGGGVYILDSRRLPRGN